MYFLATTDKQLGVCLRMLYADGIQPFVEVVMSDKKKIEFHISATVDDEQMLKLKDRYEIMIS